jgi:hypothetical protein
MPKQFIAASLLLLALAAASCDLPKENANIKVVNHWDRVVIFSLDGQEVARVQPLTKVEKEVDEGSYRVKLTLETGVILFEQQFFIKEQQEVAYSIQSDGTVLASGGATD